MSEVQKLGAAAIAMGALAAIVLVGMAVAQGFKDQTINQTYHCGLNSTNGTSGTLLYDGCAAGYNTATYFMTGLTIFGSFAAVVVLAVIGRQIIKLFNKD